jgi:hypothetical protein
LAHITASLADLVQMIIDQEMMLIPNRPANSGYGSRVHAVEAELEDDYDVEEEISAIKSSKNNGKGAKNKKKKNKNNAQSAPVSSSASGAAQKFKPCSHCGYATHDIKDCRGYQTDLKMGSERRKKESARKQAEWQGSVASSVADDTRSSGVSSAEASGYSGQWGSGNANGCW